MGAAEAVRPNPVPPLLEVATLDAAYGPLQVLWNISLSVREGEFVALIGPNGSGKTTLLNAISGLLKTTRGSVSFGGEPLRALGASDRVRRGLVFISEGLNLFLALSVYENLLLGAYTVADRKRVAERLAFVLELFPVLGQRLRQLAGTLSGGERRMLGIARGLMCDPRLLMVDEPSMGLAPNLAEQVFCALEELNRKGRAILLTEQNVNRALHTAERAYVLEHGHIFLEGDASELLKTDHVRKSYLGLL